MVDGRKKGAGLCQFFPPNSHYGYSSAYLFRAFDERGLVSQISTTSHSSIKLIECFAIPLQLPCSVFQS